MKCFLCKKDKSKEEFYKDRSRYSGFSSRCKICDSTIYSRSQRINRKRKVIEHYGRKCACCGEKNIYFLTLDHINNDGYKERMDARRTSGDNFYKWVIKKGYPTNLQVLCWNCNCAKGVLGYCPHKSSRA